jgi:hypothetical protein
MKRAGVYGTEDVAIALIVAKRFGGDFAARQPLINRLLFQQAKDGGWITDYSPNGKPAGLANVETTALAILALNTIGG